MMTQLRTTWHVAINDAIPFQKYRRIKKVSTTFSGTRTPNFDLNPANNPFSSHTISLYIYKTTHLSDFLFIYYTKHYIKEV